MSAPWPARGESAAVLDSVVITATRIAEDSRDLPVSIDRIGAQTIRTGQLQVNLSESLMTIPGVSAQSRQNYAQDLQLSVRGFGARSSFGVRGVRLYSDGIPGTMPDGQGQFSQFDLSCADHIEVLRGSFLGIVRQLLGRRDLHIHRGCQARASDRRNGGVRNFQHAAIRREDDRRRRSGQLCGRRLAFPDRWLPGSFRRGAQSLQCEGEHPPKRCLETDDSRQRRRNRHSCRIPWDSRARNLRRIRARQA